MVTVEKRLKVRFGTTNASSSNLTLDVLVYKKAHFLEGGGQQLKRAGGQIEQ
jgi:hypothetical protein